jgi:photosystem II stability/assembly factor-like uncharacterized protein
MVKFIPCLLIVFFILSCKKTNTSPNLTPTPATPDTLNAWVKYPKIDSNSLIGFEDIWFIDSLHGIGVTSGQTMLSGDGGMTWKYIPNTQGGYNLKFLDSLNGFAQGAYLSKTTDGGRTWTVNMNGGGFYLQFITPTTGFSYRAGISSTHDGGNSWISIFNPAVTNGQRYPFFFLDTLRGFSLMNGNSYQTVDGGASWQMLGSATTLDFNSFYKMQFLDTLHGYSGAPNGLLKTSDGGKTWTNCLPVAAPADGQSTSFIVPQFFDVNNGYCMTSHNIFKTTNGGQTWTTSMSLGTEYLLGMHFLDMNTGWACTGDGYVLRLRPN